MTPKETLIQAIERSPDDLVEALLHLLSVLQRQTSLETDQQTQPKTESASIAAASKRLHRKQGVLVIETGNVTGFDINELIGEMREERIQQQIELGN
ncbi:hypothetical protein GS597_17605 [Synechococcales cyanobacterium C]|uniref:Uncharacterized protein n=1 Tax=Petrachloros mirabilis ULC683 TaxID=2781853 RepID=A0A8K2A223_9CYAN|nr:hypothetical protein [Petrachloros mirabilis]NCJ08288.1 hypothetical protein [Petrachloros mirabilis ULC683]